jgi:flagellar P-ring protein precursor FlgI
MTFSRPTVRSLQRQLLALVGLLLVLATPCAARADKLRDLADVGGARENQLVGYGIVGGLAGTGDDLTVPFASQSILSLLRRLGVQVDATQMQQMMLRNVAAVVVTASLPAFARAGTKIDVTIASIGNARSLSGGVLVQTVLKGPDQHPYAVAQGSILVGGFEAHGLSGSSIRSGATNAGRIAEGALVERDVPTTLVTDGKFALELRTPGFTVAARIAEAVNAKLGGTSARAEDGGRVAVTVPAEYEGKLVDLMAILEEIDVVPVRRARVVINERTGTIVAGGDVRLSPVAVVHGNLTIVVKETRAVSQPTTPFTRGRTVVTPESRVSADEGNRDVRYVPAAPSLSDVASAMGTLGLPPRELGSVLQALRAAGALEAEVVIQ